MAINTKIDWKAWFKKFLALGGVALFSTAAIIFISVWIVLHDKIYIDDVALRGISSNDANVGTELAAMIKDRITRIYHAAAEDARSGLNFAIGPHSQPNFQAFGKSLITTKDVISVLRLIPRFEEQDVSIRLDVSPEGDAKDVLYFGVTAPYRVTVRSTFAETD